MRFYKPIFCCDLEGAAETQQAVSEQGTKLGTGIVSVETVSGYKVKESPRVVDRWLDAVVHVAGSAPIFLVIIVGLLAWALMGIRFANSDVWVAAISDVQAILCYVFDSFLMRQLLREYSEQRSAMAEIKSRCNSHSRMLAKVKEKLGPEGIRRCVETYNSEPLCPLDHGFRTQSWFARWIILSAKMFGHITTVGLYWVGIFVWLGFGHHCHWSDRWQLYINDATSALMVLVFAFLACLRECYADYTNTCVDAIFRLDAALEKELRHLSQDELPNISETIMPPKESYLQVVIFYYADVIGTLVGIIVLLLVIITWAAAGPAFHFNNTWWLLIGTYAGLISDLEEADSILFAGLSLPIPVTDTTKPVSLTQRVSRSMDAVSSHLLMVVAGFMLTIGCIITSSAMHWSLTGQLISNVPPSIIETFFMLILITGQNDAEAQARVDLSNTYYRRQRLLSFVKHVKSTGEQTQMLDMEDAV